MRTWCKIITKLDAGYEGGGGGGGSDKVCLGWAKPPPHGGKKG